MTIDNIFSELEQISADYVCVHFHKDNDKLVFITSIQNDDDVFDDTDNPTPLQKGLESFVTTLILPIANTLAQGNYKFNYKTRKITNSIEF